MSRENLFNLIDKIREPDSALYMKDFEDVELGLLTIEEKIKIEKKLKFKMTWEGSGLVKRGDTRMMNLSITLLEDYIDEGYLDEWKSRPDILDRLRADGSNVYFSSRAIDYMLDNYDFHKEIRDYMFGGHSYFYKIAQE